MKTDTDLNGNSVLKFEKSDLGGARGFSIQTNGNLPKTHREGIGEHTIPEAREWIEKFGTPRQKELFGIKFN